MQLTTEPERMAEAAEELPAFSGLKLLHVKRQVAAILELIGRDGIFDEYTIHNITHVDHMLRTLEWLIPSETKSRMSSADWMLIVLAVYFHDLGMLVTRDEFANRDQSGFRDFVNSVLFAGPEGEDYRGKVEDVYKDDIERERFLYQEFVRHKHPERVKAWLSGNAYASLGIANTAVKEVDKLLSSLDLSFRRDLGFVCESHHLDDLKDLGKYRLSQPYGDSDAETANLQYAAIMLRTSDLLHITSDRAPTFLLKFINPADPVSQQEWAKQRAVKRVRAQLGFNEEGNPDEKAVRDTIEVFAHFQEAEGFFGLTAYLAYAKQQLRQCFEWAEYAQTRGAMGYLFPWRNIDDSQIETSGFLAKQFEFEIDQAKILDLLTGHTLYNDTNVVIRELIQNAIDAVRLQRILADTSGEIEFAGRVVIEWNTNAQTLAVQDNGTGMTQEIIERHLLRVGSSRYQDPDFQKSFPSFSAISRFGIGILSAFMIADEVEIVTCHPEEPQARLITLRSVHGKYLIRLLDKELETAARMVGPHGTRIVLRVRRSAPQIDVLEAVKHWILFPVCAVEVRINSHPVVKVGYDSPRDALVAIMKEAGIEVIASGESRSPDPQTVVVREWSEGGLTLAYAVKWSEYFREWSFLHFSSERSQDPEKLSLLERRLGTAVEGIRVESGSPGWSRLTLAAIANTSGPSAPKTNVARSGLESTSEHEEMVREIYRILRRHVESEFQHLHLERGFSVAWAAQELKYLVAPLRPERAARPGELERELEHLPFLIIEASGRRSAVSPETLSSEPGFWTIDWEFMRSVESLIREAPGSVSLTSVIGALSALEVTLPPGPVLSMGALNLSSFPGSAAFRGREVDTMIVREDLRRVDLRWSHTALPPRWRVLRGEGSRMHMLRVQGYRLYDREAFGRQIYVGQGPITLEGTEGRVAVDTHSSLFMLPDTPLARYLIGLFDAIDADPSNLEGVEALLVFVEHALQTRDLLTLERVEGWFGRQGIVTRGVDFGEFVNAFNASPRSTFNASAWIRGEE